MEIEEKKFEIDNIGSRKKETRSLFKKCFKNNLFSLVPFEIWRDLIVSNADRSTIANLTQTCWGFKGLVDDSMEIFWKLALSLRKEGQIDLASQYLLKCANNNNSTAAFHLGNAYFECGWGLISDRKKAAKW